MERFYREQFRTEGRMTFRLLEGETDLFIISDADVREALRTSVVDSRQALESYIRRRPAFATALEPLEVEPDAPPIVQEMAMASRLYGVGPMAAVAGAVAGRAGEAVQAACTHLVIENGGDIYLKSPHPLTIGVFAGQASPFTGRLRFRIDSEGGSLGICTSSGTVGHSLSFGRSDAVVTVADRADLADAAATAIGNRIRHPADIDVVMEDERRRGLLRGLIVVIGERMGAWGALTLA